MKSLGNYVYEVRIDKQTNSNKREKEYFLKYFAESKFKRSR